MGVEERANLVKRVEILEHIVHALADRLGFVMTTLRQSCEVKSSIVGGSKVVTKTLEDLYRESVKNAEYRTQMAGDGSDRDQASGASRTDRQEERLIIPG